MNSDNQYGECCKCPAKMNDDRLFNNYLLNSQLNKYIKNVNGLTNENEYRLFLQKNASKIMANERQFSTTNKICDFNNENKTDSKTEDVTGMAKLTPNLA